MTTRISEFCDFACPHAGFPPAETAGLCRTMSAVWCKKLKALVNKNTPCEWRRSREAAKGNMTKTKKVTKTKTPKGKGC